VHLPARVVTATTGRAPRPRAAVPSWAGRRRAASLRLREAESFRGGGAQLGASRERDRLASIGVLRLRFLREPDRLARGLSVCHRLLLSFAPAAKRPALFDMSAPLGGADKLVVLAAEQIPR